MATLTKEILLAFANLPQGWNFGKGIPTAPNVYALALEYGIY